MRFVGSGNAGGSVVWDQRRRNGNHYFVAGAKVIAGIVSPDPHLLRRNVRVELILHKFPVGIADVSTIFGLDYTFDVVIPLSNCAKTVAGLGV